LGDCFLWTFFENHRSVANKATFYKKLCVDFDEKGFGGVAQWTSHPPEEQKARVRIPEGFYIGSLSNAVVYVQST
jgi:hypothetical protein